MLHRVALQNVLRSELTIDDLVVTFYIYLFHFLSSF
jgi:hypothetical protein